MKRQATAVVVLAAGAASRFGAPKQALLLPRVLERVALAGIEDVVVVLGAHEVELPPGVRAVHAPDWERGPGRSLRSGLAALGPEVGAAVVVLADGPLLDPRSLGRVVAAWRAGAGDLVAASYRGVRGHPVVVDRRLWRSLPDDGARALAAVLVPCDDLGEPGDVDTPADLEPLGLDADN